MNLPNQLTVGRFFLTLLFVGALSTDWRLAYTAGLLLFALAGITDYADGEIARRYKLETDFGRLMDPLVDKIMVAAAFICLVGNETFREAFPAWVPPWVAIVIVSREFLITGLRLLAANKGVVLAAESAGKHKTIWQIVTVLFFLLLLALRELAAVGVGHTDRWWWLAWKFGGGALLVLTVGLTLYSGLSYLWRNRGLIQAG